MSPSPVPRAISPTRTGRTGRRRRGRVRPDGFDLAVSVAVTFAGVLWLTVFHHATGGREAHELPLVTHALRDGLLALPAVLVAVRVALSVLTRVLRVPATDAPAALVASAVAGAAAVAMAAGQPVHERLFDAHEHAGLPLGIHLGRDALIALAVCLPVAMAATVALRRWAAARSTTVARLSPSAGRRALTRAALAGTAAVALAVPTAAVGAVGEAPTAAAATGVCATATRTIRYDVVAMEVDLPLNGWGDHVPDGRIYALANGDARPDAAEIAREPGLATPLVIRAAVGDCLSVHFTNSIEGARVGMHVDGVVKDVKDSDGSHVGTNPDTTVPAGQDITYTWLAQREGQWPINDYGSGTTFGLEGQQDTTSHGLYGGLIVLPAGSTWHDPRTGGNLLAADLHAVGAPVFADVHVPGPGNDFRDYAQVFLDEPEGICAPATPGNACPDPTFPTTRLVDASFGFNYRTEPLRNRLRAVLEHAEGRTVRLPNGTVIRPEDHFCDGWTNDQSAAQNEERLTKDLGLSGCLGEESHLQSWAFGDQGKLTQVAAEESDLLTVGGTGGTVTLTVTDATRYPFVGEVGTTAPIPVPADGAGLAAAVQSALDALRIVPMSPGHLPAPGDITVTAVDPGVRIRFGQHFSGHDLVVTAQASDGATATVTEEEAGAITVLSDALIPDAYRGDPVHMRLIHAGVTETHPFHQHTNRWRQESQDRSSTRLDVQSIGPGQTFDLVYEGGAGEAIAADPQNVAAGAKPMDEWLRGSTSRPDLAEAAITTASNGDQVFHCHLYPHFAQGFWGALRVYDRQRPIDPALWPAGTPRTYPDATPLEPLAMLPDYDTGGRLAPSGTLDAPLTPLPDDAHPGYPLFVKGEYLQRAFRAPGAVVADRYGSPAANWRRPGDTVRDHGTTTADGVPVTTALEQSNMVTRPGPDGRPRAVPGAFFIDPCPTSAPRREYHPTAVDATIVYNSAGWKDPDAKMYVEAPPSDPADPGTSYDVARAIRPTIAAPGGWQPEPYNIRARLGECVDMLTTNATNLDDDEGIPLDVHDGRLVREGSVYRLDGGTAYHPPTLMTELSTHVHLVRFDQLATDGTSIGWNYVQAPMVGQTYHYTWFADVALRTVYFHDHQNPNTHQQHGLWAAMNVEPAGSTFRDPRTGGDLVAPYCAPVRTPAMRGPTAGSPPCYGVGSVADIIATTVSPGDSSFREFTVNYSDFAPMQDASGRPVNPPRVPDDYATDQGGMAINYRNEPFPIRVNSASTGAKKEPAYVFSSAVHGDPSTPVFRAYQRDPVIFRFMGGAHEEGHNFTLTGHRWLHEPDDPHSSLYDSQFVMIAEFFNFEVSGSQVIKRGGRAQGVERARESGETESGSSLVLPGGAGAPGDYLYGSQPLNDLWNGMWGLFRVPATQVSDLKPLPNNAGIPTGAAGTQWPALRPGQAIAAPPAARLTTPCPTTSPTKAFAVTMVQAPITYNEHYGDHDPNGVAYVLNDQLDPVTGKPKAGTALKPLFIRANEGDCVQISLKNALPAAGVPVHDGDPVNPVELIGGVGTSEVWNLVGGTPTKVRPTWPAGNRASMHASGLTRYSVTTSDGSAVGYNWDSTVAPGASAKYLFHVDTRAIGVVNLSNYANLRGTRHHGAWGGLVVEPRGAKYLRPDDLSPLASGEEAVIQYPDGAAVRSYREFVVDVQDGLNLFRNGRQVPDAATADVPGGRPDFEDQGERGINYRTERFANRLAEHADPADVFSSTVFRDPATPVFRAYGNDPVMVRILNGQDLPRVHTFGLSGHNWRYELNDPDTNVINGQGGVNTGRTFTAGVCAGNNAPLVLTGLTPTCTGTALTGDHLYNDRNFAHMLSGGVWGLVRVLPPGQADLKPLPRK